MSRELKPAEKVLLEKSVKTLEEKIDACRDEMDRLVEVNARQYDPEIQQELLMMKRKCGDYKDSLKDKRIKLNNLKL